MREGQCRRVVSHLVEAESWRRGQGQKRLLVGETDKPWGRKRLPPQLDASSGPECLSAGQGLTPGSLNVPSNC